MSAHLCTPRHIGSLASWYVDRRNASHGYLRRVLLEDESVEDSELAPQLAVLLAQANLDSVAYRYPDDGPGNRPGPTGLEDDTEYLVLCSAAARRTFDLDREGGALQVLKACKCLEYQSCEHPSYVSSTAYSALQAIMNAATSALPGYDDAEWGWPTPDALWIRSAEVRARVRLQLLGTLREVTP